MVDSSNGAPTGAIVPAATGAATPAAGSRPSNPARKAAGSTAALLGKSLQGAPAGSVNYHTVRGVKQPAPGTRLFIVLTEGGELGYSLTKGGKFLTMAAAGKGAAGAWDKGAPFAAPYTVPGVKKLHAMLASLQGITANPDQGTAAATLAGHLPPDVAVKCGLPRVTRVSGARRGTGRADSI